jgi:hypothetical protein
MDPRCLAIMTKTRVVATWVGRKLRLVSATLSPSMSIQSHAGRPANRKLFLSPIVMAYRQTSTLWWIDHVHIIVQPMARVSRNITASLSPSLPCSLPPPSLSLPPSYPLPQAQLTATVNDDPCIIAEAWIEVRLKRGNVLCEMNLIMKIIACIEKT